ncbi:MAG: hypothetical protein E2O65_03975, partial [Gammaproteobacteria bacterium]
MNRIKLPRSIVAQVVLAMLLGVACGVFFGEFTADLQMLGDAYVRLLQMTALPNEYYLQRLRHALPDVEGILIDDIERYLQGEPPQADALLY